METQPQLHSEGGNALFFSRGRGCGHAIPDMAIADELAKLCSDIDLKFVSYGAGAQTLAAHGRRVIDLEMPDVNPLWDTVLRVGEVIREYQPGLVVSHEEFAALPVAKIFDIPTAFITDWFADADDPRMQALAYADEVIVIEEEGIFDELPCVEGKVHYTGPVLRSFRYGRADRERARQELSLPLDAVVILVLPGSWTEEKAPICDLVVPVFDGLRVSEKLLIWIAGADHEMLARRISGRSDVIVKEHDWQMDRLMVAADMAITKANRITTKELAALGVPSISISHGLNPIDDMLIERIASNTPLDARTASRKMLAEALVDALREGPRRVSIPNDGLPPKSDGAALAAQCLTYAIDRLCQQPGRVSLAAR